MLMMIIPLLFDKYKIKYKTIIIIIIIIIVGGYCSLASCATTGIIDLYIPA